MNIYVGGLPSTYEVEHLIRLFYPRAPIVQEKPTETQELFCAEFLQGELKVSLWQNGEVQIKTTQLPQNEKPEFALASFAYDFLREQTGVRPPWGKLTGVRPVRLLHKQMQKGKTEAEIEDFFLRRYDCTPEKYKLTRAVAQIQAPILNKERNENEYSLYVGIPFCPTRCSYCSFVCCDIEKTDKLVEPYVEKLCLELEDISKKAKNAGLKLCTIYVGGGTPTSVSAKQLRKILSTIEKHFDTKTIQEYTVEAGRADCTDAEKLAILKEFGVNRISINPQTFSENVLKNIGRVHSVEQVLECYKTARELGHNMINMDLIAGLPGDTVESFTQTLKQTLELAPENITVHTLTLKRASKIVIENQDDDYADVAKMLSACDVLWQAGYRPYYLYRQKNTLQNLENIGWSKPNCEGYYNIYIMEEIQTILSAGAGASTKFVRADGSVIERVFNFKYPNEYINRFDEIIKRKEL